MRRVIYLTGAPASGKSTAARLLAEGETEIELFEYGARLLDLVRGSSGIELAYSELRAQSSAIITKEHVEALDAQLVEYVASDISDRTLIIDSHAVTKESFGFRVTPFSIGKLGALGIQEIWVVFASPEAIISRISEDAEGRPPLTPTEAEHHAQLQGNVAISYAVLLGVPVFFFDNEGNVEHVVARMKARIARASA